MQLCGAWYLYDVYPQTSPVIDILDIHKRIEDKGDDTLLSSSGKFVRV